MLKSFIILFSLLSGQITWAMSCGSWSSASQAAQTQNAVVMKVQTEFLDQDTREARLRVEKVYKGDYAKSTIDFPATMLGFDPIKEPEEGSWVAILTQFEGQYYFAGCSVNGLTTDPDGSVYVPLSFEGEDTKMSESEFISYINGTHIPTTQGVNCSIMVMNDNGFSFSDSFFLTESNSAKVFSQNFPGQGLNSELGYDVYLDFNTLYAYVTEPFYGVSSTSDFVLSLDNAFNTYAVYLDSDKGTASLECYVEYGLPLVLKN
jgi:hypothetical protein